MKIFRAKKELEYKKIEDLKEQKQKELAAQKIKKWEDKYDQELKLKNEIEASKFEQEIKLKNKKEELRKKEDLTTKLESFEIDTNKKN